MKNYSKKISAKKGFTPAPKNQECAILTCDKRNYLVRGFTLIELIVAMFILVMVMGAMVAVSVSVFQSYQKSKAIKTVSEDVGFALNSIAKDVRMGKIYSPNNIGVTPAANLVIARNQDQVGVCYSLTSLTLASCDPVDCASNCKNIVDLTGTGMTFSNSGFYNMPTDKTSATKIRGWVEINLNIETPTMATDSIHVETTVSSRDYGISP